MAQIDMTGQETVQILGTGYYKPARVISNADLIKIVDTSDEWISTRTGIKERRVVEKETATSDIALLASRNALERSKVKARDIDLIIVGTVTPDMLTPSTACLIQNALGAVNAAAFDISAGCTGFLYALVTAQKFMLDKSINKVLVVGAETLSKVNNWTDRNTCVIFADGAGAMVLGKGAGNNGIISTYLGADGSGSGLITIPAGGSRLPATHATVDGNLHCIKMQGQDVFKFAIQAIPDCAYRVLEQAGLAVADVDHFVFHQANMRIIESAVKRMNIPMEKVLTNIARNGNTSSASVPTVLAEADEAGIIKSGDIVLTVAIGAGLTTGAAIIRWGHD